MSARGTILALIGKPDPKPELITENQTADDIADQMTAKHKRCAADYDKFSYLFAGGSLEQVCRRLYDFCKKNLRYVEESEESQYVSAPQTMLNRKYADCKGMALFCGGVLDSLQRLGYYSIKWRYRFVSYKLFDSIPGHVFVVIKNQGQDIFCDPVMGSFNYHKPYWTGYDVNAMDTGAAKINGCGCEAQAIGDTAYTAGNLLSATAPALAAINPILGGGVQVLGLFLKLFGDKYSTSTGVRWLTQKYQYYVLGQAGVTSDNLVDESKTQAAQAFFYAVLGVPIFDKFRLHTLMGTDPDTGRRLVPFPSQDQRATTYLNYWDVQQAGTTKAQALAAAAIAEKIPLEINSLPGAWKNLPVNPAVAGTLNAQIQQGIIPQPTGAGDMFSNILGNSNILLWIVVGGIIFLLTRKKS